MSTGKDQKRLGKGLSALLQSTVVHENIDTPAGISQTVHSRQPTPPVRSDTSESAPKTAPATPEPASKHTVRVIRCNLVRPNPYQPRSEITEQSLDELVQSIQKTGLIQPITVRQVGQGYELIAGERRWRAVQKAGLIDIPAIVRSASDEEMIELALIENIFREDLNAIDRAVAYRRYCDQFALTADQVAGRLGEDRTTVTNYLRLLDLPETVQQMVKDGQISMGHARALIGLENREKIERFANLVVTNFFSVRTLEELIRKEKNAPQAATKPTPTTPDKRPHIRDLEEQFMRALITKVEIVEARKKGAGRIVIQYNSLDDFDRIAERVGIRLQ